MTNDHKKNAHNKPKTDIDWHAQWAAHAPGFHEGFVYLDLKRYSKNLSTSWPSQLCLQPGPGFGDLSHPTTHLVLKLMPLVVKSKHVLDIGCGSGILSFAALSMGAASVCGIDIDEDALTHAQANSRLNAMEQAVEFKLPEDYLLQKKRSDVILMNMIQSEQCQAWQTLAPQLSSHIQEVVTSGILAEGRAAYLKQAALWGWTLVKEAAKEKWLGFHFKQG